MNRLLIIIAIFCLTSCKVNKEISRANSVNSQLDKLIDLNQKKVENGTQSPEIGSVMDSTYKTMKTNISILVDSINELKADKSLKNIAENARKVDELKKKLSKRSESYQTTIETFLKLYKLETFKSFESSRFFKSGEYKINEDDAKLILNDLEPIINDIVKIIEKDNHLNMEVIIGIYGYTDEQEVSIGGNLYKDLVSIYNLRNPSQSELNQKLSELRAKSLADILQVSVENRNDYKKNYSHIFYNINWLGRGFSKLPFKNMAPKKIDEKRRVVTVIYGFKPILIDGE
jgi:outer membrane protein OmpA-like peptidoglycan-associated protein